MSKYLLYSDVHISEFSSIVKMQGEKHSARLENLLRSINWAEKQAIENRCDEIICLGDFFDNHNLNSKEISAVKEINWANLPHTFLIGNHEGFGRALYYNSTNILRSTNYLYDNNFSIISQPAYLETDYAELFFIPYYLEDDRKPLKEYIDNFSKNNGKKKIVFSHNDIKGIQYGCFESKEGFDITEIEENCDLFLNGHVHNGTKFCKNGINLGNLTGQNFGEDASKYSHCIFILDTENSSIESLENPYALNFYTLSISNICDLDKLRDLKDNAVLSIKCLDSLKPKLEQTLDELKDKIIAKRVISAINSEHAAETITISQLAEVNYLKEFYDFSVNKLGNNSLLLEELQKIITD